MGVIETCVNRNGKNSGKSWNGDGLETESLRRSGKDATLAHVEMKQSKWHRIEAFDNKNILSIK